MPAVGVDGIADSESLLTKAGQDLCLLAASGVLWSDLVSGLANNFLIQA